MLLTKDDATKKWCPLARSEYYSACKCIADGCAMWRWTTITNPSNGARRFQVADNPTATSEKEAGLKPAGCSDWEFSPSTEHDPAGWVEPENSAAKRRQGYCGLAGKPET